MVTARTEGEDVVAPLRRGHVTYRVRVVERDGRRRACLETGGTTVDLPAARLLEALGAPQPYLVDVDAVQAALDAVPAATAAEVLETVLMGRSARTRLIVGVDGGLSPTQQQVLEAARPHEMYDAPATSTATLLLIARGGDVEIAQALVARERLPVEVARTVFETLGERRDPITWDVHARLGAAYRAHPATGPAPDADPLLALHLWAAWVATSDRARDRVQAAAWSDQDPEVLIALTDDPDVAVRTTLAGHAHLPVTARVRLSFDPDPTVRRLARGRYSPAQFQALAEGLTLQEEVPGAGPDRRAAPERP